jgi:hypothetical protein
LAVVYYIAGLIVSFFAGQISTALQIKGRDLYKTLEKALGEEFKDILGDDLVKNLEPIKKSPITHFILALKKLFKRETKLFIDKIPASTLSSALLGKFDSKEHAATVVGSLVNPGFEELKKFSEKLDTDIIQLQENAKKNIEVWLDQVISSASALYTRNVRIWVILIAFFVTVGMNIDTIAIGKYLYEEPAARELAVKEMDIILESAEKDQDGNLVLPESYEAEAAKLTSLNIPMWWPDDKGPIDHLREMSEAAFWTKIAGWLLTWAAVSQGSSFWYDILKKLKWFYGKVKTTVKSSQEETSS